MRSAFGSDYVIELEPGSVDLFKWNGTTYAGGSPQTSLTFTYTAAGPTIHISALELGKTKAFNFFVDAVAGIATNASGDSTSRTPTTTSHRIRVTGPSPIR